jgi:hypothetical protein
MPVDRRRRFEAELLEYFRARHVDSDVTLPEEDVDRDEATFQPSKRDG